MCVVIQNRLKLSRLYLLLHWHYLSLLLGFLASQYHTPGANIQSLKGRIRAYEERIVLLKDIKRDGDARLKVSVVRVSVPVCVSQQGPGLRAATSERQGVGFSHDSNVHTLRVCRFLV